MTDIRVHVCLYLHDRSVLRVAHRQLDLLLRYSAWTLYFIRSLEQPGVAMSSPSQCTVTAVTIYTLKL